MVLDSNVEAKVHYWLFFEEFRMRLLLALIIGVALVNGVATLIICGFDRQPLLTAGLMSGVILCAAMAYKHLTTNWHPERMP